MNQSPHQDWLLVRTSEAPTFGTADAQLRLKWHIVESEYLKKRGDLASTPLRGASRAWNGIVALAELRYCPVQEYGPGVAGLGVN
jgi:hypothetical protein